MNPERLGQLQHYIGSAREKQERWKSRVQGGNLFKKNQVRFIIGPPLRRIFCIAAGASIVQFRI